MRGRPNLGPKLVPLQKKGWRTPMYYIRWSEKGRSRERATGHSTLAEAEREFRSWLAENLDLVSKNSANPIHQKVLRDADEEAAAPPAYNPGDLVLYFVQAGEEGPIKIGITANLARRMSALQNGTSATLTIVRLIHGSHALERRLLRIFRPSRIRGEWHRPDPLLLRYIEELRPLCIRERQSYSRNVPSTMIAGM